MIADSSTPVGIQDAHTVDVRFELLDMGPADLADLLELQSVTLAMLQGSAVLRENSADMFTRCLADSAHRVVGWRANGLLVSAAILYDGGTSEENIRNYTTSDPEKLAASINLKLVMTRKGFARANLSRSLIADLEQSAIERGKSQILATIHPENAASRAMFESLGYGEVGQASTGYGIRLIYGLELPVTANATR